MLRKRLHTHTHTHTHTQTRKERTEGGGRRGRDRERGRKKEREGWGGGRREKGRGRERESSTCASVTDLVCFYQCIQSQRVLSRGEAMTKVRLNLAVGSLKDALSAVCVCACMKGVGVVF